MATNKNEETGVIMKIQKQSGCLLIVIGVAMLAFVLTDLLSSGPSVFAGTQNVVGEIAGDIISYEDYSQKVEDLRLFYQQDLGGSGEDEQFREMAWNQLIQDKIIKREHEKLGIVVGAEEFKDITTGANPDPSIVQAFQDQETKQFNRSQLINFLEEQMQDDERKYRIWYNYYEVPLRERTEGTKYDKMVKDGIFVTKLDALSSYNDERREFSGVGVGLAYAGISDSTISFTDGDLKSYLSKNKDKYQQEASRDIAFVVLNVFPSAEDSMETKKWAEGLVEKFRNNKKDSAFVTNNRSSVPFDPTYKGRGSYPPDVEDRLFSADTGTVIGPIFSDGSYNLYKVTGIKNDSVASMRARHVLISLSDGTEAETLDKGRRLMAELRSGAKNFETEAGNNYDGTGANKGDLGWMPQTGSTNVPSELRDEIFKRSNGDWFVSKSSRGIHVVQVTGGRTTKTIQVAVMSRGISPGSKADQEVSRVAADVQYKTQDNDDFMGVVESMKLPVREASKISVANPVIPGVSNTREIVRWLYDDKTKVGDVSDVIDLQDRYIIAQVTAIREKGTASLEDVRETVTADYIQEEKAKTLINQMEEALAKTQNPEQLAKDLNTAVRMIPAASLIAPQLPGIGAEPILQGVLIGLPEGKHSKPVKGVSGVYIVWNNGEVKSNDAVYDEVEIKRFLQSQSNQIVDAGVLEALRAKGEIKDNRYRFF